MNGAASITGAIGVVILGLSASSLQGQAPAPIVPLKIPATYVSAQNTADQLRLNADCSFSLQEAGQTYHGTFVVSGSTLELNISDGSKTAATIHGDNLTDSSGQAWVLREQPAQPAPIPDVVKNQDVINLVKAGLDDEIIIAKIAGSKCQFDTSPDALTQLKQSGVSTAVMKAVIGAGTPRATSGDAASASPRASPGAPSRADASPNLPTNTAANPSSSVPSIQPSAGPTRVTGRVVWNEMPVLDARVQLRHWGDSFSLPPLASAVSAADGTFTIQASLTGNLTIFAQGPTGEWSVLAFPETILAGQSKNVGDLRITKHLQLLSPANSATTTTTTPTLQWSPFHDTAHYDVYVSNNTTRQRVFLQSTQATQITLSPALQSGQQYHWSVFAHNSSGHEIASATADFTIASPSLPANIPSSPPAPPVQPSAGPTQVTGRVVWNGMPVPNVRVQLKQVGDYSSLPELASTMSAADGTFTLLAPPTGSLMIYALAPNTDYWAWFGYPVKITAGEPKNVGDLAIAKKLQLLSPANSGPNGDAVTTTTPTLQWTAFPGAARYAVYVFNNTTHQRVLLQSIQSTQITVSPPLQSGQRYQWSVHAYNSSGGEIAYWSAWYFTIASLTPPGERLGERNYFEFKLGKTKTPQRVADITLLLKATDPRNNTYTVDVMADDKLTQKKDKKVNEPVQFYTSKAEQPYELVVNSVQKDLIVGYLATPKPSANASPNPPAPAAGQPSSRAMLVAHDAPSKFLGYWINEASDHRSILRALISEQEGKILVNPFGICPWKWGRECDWGTVEAAVSNDVAVAVWRGQFRKRRLELSLKRGKLTIVNTIELANNPGHNEVESCVLNRSVDKEPNIPLLPSPVLISPATGETFDIYPRTTPLRWQPVSNAAAYVLEWSFFDKSGDTWSDATVVRIFNTAFTVDFVGAQPGRWRVAAQNRNGREGQWSEWRDFKYLR